jgi:hypothetical protein
VHWLALAQKSHEWGCLAASTAAYIELKLNILTFVFRRFKPAACAPSMRRFPFFNRKICGGWQTLDEHLLFCAQFVPAAQAACVAARASVCEIVVHVNPSSKAARSLRIKAKAG